MSVAGETNAGSVAECAPGLARSIWPPLDGAISMAQPSEFQLLHRVACGMADLIVANQIDIQGLDFFAPIPPVSNMLAEAISDELSGCRIPVIYFTDASPRGSEETAFKPLSLQSLRQLARARSGVIIGGANTGSEDLQAMLRIPSLAGMDLGYCGVSRESDATPVLSAQIDQYWLFEDFVSPVLSA